MQTLSEIRQLLAERGLRPRHRLGQNFLHDQNHLRHLVQAAAIAPGDLVLEVGPGTGTLTEALLDAGADVIACEIDDALASIIEERHDARLACGEPTGGRLTLIRGDALARLRALNPEVVRLLGDRPFKLVANLPFQIASPLISTLLIDHHGCIGQYVTIQKEVAERLLAAPSTRAYGALGVIVQALADVRRLAILSPGCFWPEPDVTSAMVAIVPAPGARERFAGRERDFARSVIELFTRRRKQLGSTIGRQHRAWPTLQQAGITPDLRPEALAPDQTMVLWQATRGDDSRPIVD